MYLCECVYCGKLFLSWEEEWVCDECEEGSDTPEE